MLRSLILALTVSTIPAVADIFDIAACTQGWVCSDGPWLRWLAPIPEPASIALLGGAMLFITAGGRRVRRRKPNRF